MLPLLTACLALEGDLGRPERHPTYEAIADTLGRSVARDRREAVSGFSYTQDERDMRRVGDQLRMRHHELDWTYQVVQEVKRNRFVAVKTDWFTVDRYYQFLSAEGFRTGSSQYYKIRDEAVSDCAKIEAFLPISDRVLRADDRRLENMRSNPTVDPAFRENARARVEENDTYIQDVGEAVIYRYESYLYAIERLSVEIPDERAEAAARAGLSQLKTCADIHELGRRNYDDFNGKRLAGPLAARAIQILRR